MFESHKMHFRSSNLGQITMKSFDFNELKFLKSISVVLRNLKNHRRVICPIKVALTINFTIRFYVLKKFLHSNMISMISTFSFCFFTKCKHRDNRLTQSLNKFRCHHNIIRIISKRYICIHLSIKMQ